MKLDSKDAIILGAIQGVTEFLPVSSTGHLILAKDYVLSKSPEMKSIEKKDRKLAEKTNFEFVSIDKKNRDLITKDEQFIKNRSNEKFNQTIYLENNTKTENFKENFDNYLSVIQFGTVLVLVIFYWQKIILMIKSLHSKNTEGLHLLRNLIFAFLPAAVFGFLLDGWVQKNLYTNKNVTFAIGLGGFFIILIEKLRQKNKIKTNEVLDIHTLSWKQSLFIGFLQTIALFPGISRSTMTIIGGYLAGLKPTKAVEFSFLLGLITMSSASAYKILKNGSAILESFDFWNVFLGCLFAFIFGSFTVRWFINYLSKNSLLIFGYYRIFLFLVLIFLKT